VTVFFIITGINRQGVFMDHLDALLEIGCEELPTDYINLLQLSQIESDAKFWLNDKKLTFENVEVNATPRRIVLFVKGLITEQKQESTRIAGPKKVQAYGPDGKLSPAGQGFLRKVGIAESELIIEGEQLFAQVIKPSQPTKNLLSDFFLKRIQNISFPKTMRWEPSGARFARPVRWMVALFGDEVISFQFADVVSGRKTDLHPLNSSRTAIVPNTSEYFAILKKGQIVLSVQERINKIQSALEKEAARLGGRVVADPESKELLHTVTMMVENPGVVAGEFHKKFLVIPREIIVTAMREHQRYFAVEDAEGKLLPAFLAIYDNPLADPANIQPGCERVLEARLKDAEFFFQEDMKRQLADLVPELSRVLWIKGLGNLLDKTQRLERLTAWLAQKLDAAQEKNAVAAAHLAKADLVTNMVQEKEFTSLQGVMGTYYALAQGVPEPVALAIREQYQPRGAGDEVPRTPAGRLLSLADKLDHLVGCWGAGFIPNGAKDPYALRRAAQGVVAITLAAGYRFSLHAALAATISGFPQYKDRSQAIADEVQAFILGRMETELSNRHYPPDLIQALLGVWTDDLAAVVRKAEVITELQLEPGFTDQITAFSRVVNILPKGTPRNTLPAAPELAVRSDLLADGSEKELAAQVGRARGEVLALAESGDFAGVFRRLAELIPLINRYFDEVLVMDPDEAKRTNRLSLLTNLARLIWLLADFSRLVGRQG
jgi:glycyl-tRNA synthetase beta chain